MTRATPTPTIDGWIYYATTQLAGAGIGTAKLDAEIILAHTVRKSRTWLHAHGDELLTSRQREIADARLDLRCDRTPIAYIIGHKEFYGRIFRVTPATLIPRPESETMIDLLHDLAPRLQPQLTALPLQLVDVGTGSGVLGITAKLTLPDLTVTLLDTSRHALNVAEKNAHDLQAEVSLLRSDLLDSYALTPDIILANLPYVDPDWQRSPETNYEPAEALFADDHGLALIYRLIDQAGTRLRRGGLLLLEADPRQHAAIIDDAKKHGFRVVESRAYIIALAH